MQKTSSPFMNFLAKLPPFIVMGIIFVLILFSLFIFSYLIIVGIVIGLIFYLITYIRAKLWGHHHMKVSQKVPHSGRIIEHEMGNDKDKK